MVVTPNSRRRSSRSAYLRAAADLDAAPAHLLAEINAKILVEAARRISSRRMISTTSLAEAVEDAGELDRNIAAADDYDALGQSWQVERLVRRDHVLDAGIREDFGPAADRDQNIVGGIASAGDLDRMRVDKDATAVDDLDAAVIQHVDVDLRQPTDLLVLGGDQYGQSNCAGGTLQPKPAASANASANCAP